MVALKEYIDHPELLDVLDIEDLAAGMKEQPASTRARWLWVLKKQRMEGKPLKDLRLAWMHAPEMTSFHNAFHPEDAAADFHLDLEVVKQDQPEDEETRENIESETPLKGASKTPEMEEPAHSTEEKQSGEPHKTESPIGLETFKVSVDRSGADSVKDVSEESEFLQWLKHKRAKKKEGTEIPGQVPEKDYSEPSGDEREEAGGERPGKETDKTGESSPTSEEEKEALEAAIRKSIEEDEDILSPTLAEVLAEQGHIKRAIDMYEKLRLVYPEKSSFFAEKIKQLKNR